MTIRPFYEPRVLEMRLEKYAKIAIDGGIWLLGELLAQGLPVNNVFVPDTTYVFRPRHEDTSITELCRVNEDLRHRIFVAGFLQLPDNGAQATFQRLLPTHTEMLNDALRVDWRRRTGKMINLSKPRAVPSTVANELLHKLAPPR
ncbi:hypothetical protein [Afipia birgiae]|uniref:hypothetical protein n=1 Tax=Afipia birgiae TaxID=151414 RepID=UPI0003715B42|nr:hypothetical protein [Afipia birgiae]